jgi:hypothetical protein
MSEKDKVVVEKVNVEDRRRNNMNIGWKSVRVFIALLLFCICFCTYQGQTNVAHATQGNTNGAAGQSPAFYDGQLFTINLFELSHNASASIIKHNNSLNNIFTTIDLDDEQEFTPVIDAIQGDEFNPLWRQILIVFNDGFTPHQFFSDEQVQAAATGPNPEITLVPTDEVYRCSVVGGN